MLTLVQFVLGSHTKSEHGDDDVGHIDACVGIGDKHLSYLSKVSYDFAVIMTDPPRLRVGFSRQYSRLSYILVRRNLVSYALPLQHRSEGRLLHHSI